MHKEDYIRKIMTLYQQFENTEEAGAAAHPAEVESKTDDWQELVDFATLNGLDNLEVQDLIRMADLAKKVLGENRI